MNILKAIGAAFAKFWRWIRETAWVQPLLIVGGIFAIIFSIPKFTAWFNAMGAESSSAYFTSFRYSLEGEGNDEIGMTAADKLTLSLYNFSSATQAGNKDFSTYEDYRAALEKDGCLETYGEKYFLAYVANEGAGVDNAQGGFKALQDNWGVNFKAQDDKPFALKTIFTDEVSTNDDDYVVESDKSAFSRYLNGWNGGLRDFWSYVGPELIDAPYKSNKMISDTSYDHITTPEHDTFDVPTIFLVDFTKEAYESGRYGISEVIFNVAGDNDYDRATLLLNMWNHLDTNSVSASQNPFTEYYVK